MLIVTTALPSRPYGETTSEVGAGAAARTSRRRTLAVPQDGFLRSQGDLIEFGLGIDSLFSLRFLL
jgi:hypothetical protein